MNRVSSATRGVVAALAVYAATAIPGASLASDMANGRVLYQSLCSVCHGVVPLQRQSGANPATADARVIRNTIGNNPAMAFLGFLTEAQVNDIAAYLTAFASGAGPGNVSDLWWNPAENGWGVNFVHQGESVFGTLFTYDANRAPMWLVMSSGALQADGVTFSGDLYRTTGPAFNANPFTPIGPANYTRVGTMTAIFSGPNSGTLSYTVNGVMVTKTIQRLVYGARAANCVPTTASRATSTNYQDLWWNAAEGGWGINVTHQDNTLFATLFTYDASGRDLWLVMSGGVRQADGSYQGTLYRSSGPAFNANPFTPITESDLTPVGTMSFRFSNGENGTLSYTVNGVPVTKAITRLVFASPVAACN